MSEWSKDLEAFEDGGRACFIHPSRPAGYTRADFDAMSEGDASFARALFDRCGDEPLEASAARLRAAWRGPTPDAGAREALPFINEVRCQVISDEAGHLYTSGELDRILDLGGTALLRAMQSAIAGGFGRVARMDGEPGVLLIRLFFSAAAEENAAYGPLLDSVARHFAPLQADFPGAAVFVSAGEHLPEGCVSLNAWVHAARIGDEWVPALRDAVANLPGPSH